METEIRLVVARGWVEGKEWGVSGYGFAISF